MSVEDGVWWGLHHGHKHQHIIPVEWEYLWVGARAATPTHKRVTKLRCACGDEVKR